MNKIFMSLLFAIYSGTVFISIVVLIYFLRYAELIDIQLFKQYYLIILVLGVVGIVFSYRKFGIIFFSGAIIGLIVDCITTYVEAGRTTMAGGIYNFLVTAVFFVVAIIIQVRHNAKIKM